MILSKKKNRLINQAYECTSGCSQTCGKNCYSTRTTANPKCHCVCRDDSKNPCKSKDSCFGGDQYSNCAELYKKYPTYVCGRLKEKCCETCKKVGDDKTKTTKTPPTTRTTTTRPPTTTRPRTTRRPQTCRDKSRYMCPRVVPLSYYRKWFCSFCCVTAKKRNMKC